MLQIEFILTLGASRTEPAELTVALLARRSCGLHVHAAPSVSTVTVVNALVPVLTSGPVVESVTATLGQQVATMPAAVLLVCLLWNFKES